MLAPAAELSAGTTTAAPARTRTIPTTAVILGVAKWPGERRTAEQPARTLAIAPDIPARFSDRAAEAGLLEAAAELRASENVAIRLCGAAAKPRFSVARWSVVLVETGYPDSALRPLLHALQQGVSIDTAPNRVLGPRQWDHNHASLYAHVATVEAKLSKQRAAGTLIAWPRDSEARPHVVAPLGTVSKFKLYSDEKQFGAWLKDNKQQLTDAAKEDWNAFCQNEPLKVEMLSVPKPPAPQGPESVRIIHDARFGINDRGEPPSFGKLTVLRDIVEYAQPGDFLFVEDIQGAFKLVSPVPWQTILLASIFLGVLFIDTRLTFGLNMSPYLFHACVAHPLMWVVAFLCRKFDVAGRVFQYVDDHIGVARTQDAAHRLRRCLFTAMEWLDIPPEPSKRQPPSQRIVGLGLIIDTSRPTGVVVECPDDKIQRIRDVCLQALARPSISTKKLESLCGMIGFVGVSVRGAFVFSGELRAALRAANFAGRKCTTLTKATRIDLEFWSQFAASWNGVEVVLATPTIPLGHASADAMCERGLSALGLFVCGRGFRIVVDRSVWNSLEDPDSASKIAMLELVAYAALVVVCAAVFPNQHVSQHVTISTVTDNSTVRARVEKGHCRDAHANAILRLIWRVSSTTRLRSSLTWIRSEENALSDAPSRGDQLQFTDALGVYSSNLPLSAPAWWPAMFRYEPAARQPFATLNAGSALWSLVHNLGGDNVEGLCVNAQEVDLLLRAVRAELS